MAKPDAFQACDFVRFYDWTYEGHDSDLPFYLELARQYGAPILEAACGTGRVSIALARHGFRVVGIDFSKHMLAVARAKMQEQSEQTRTLLSFVLADMRAFDLKEAFSAVLVPNASLFHLDSRESLSKCFACLHKHTRVGGVVVVDVVSPKFMADQEVGKQILVADRMNPATGLRTRELNRKLLLDRDRQLVRVEHVYLEGNGESERRFALEQDYRWLERDEGADLLRRAGFADVKVLGAYDGSAYWIDSPRLILTGTRTGG